MQYRLVTVFSTVALVGAAMLGSTSVWGAAGLAQSIVTTHDIRVLANGIFSPQTTTIVPGDEVRFIMHDIGTA